jgi:hypothetical protein
LPQLIPDSYTSLYYFLIVLTRQWIGEKTWGTETVGVVVNPPAKHVLLLEEVFYMSFVRVVDCVVVSWIWSCRSFTTVNDTRAEVKLLLVYEIKYQIDE